MRLSPSPLFPGEGSRPSHLLEHVTPRPPPPSENKAARLEPKPVSL